MAQQILGVETRVVHARGGAGNTYPFGFTVWSIAQVKVAVAGVTLATNAYSVTLTASGGTVTLSIPATSDQTVVIWSETPLTRISAPADGDTFTAAVVNIPLNYQLAILQEMDVRLSRAVSMPIDSLTPPPNFPAPDAGKVIEWDSSGGLANSTVSVSAIGAAQSAAESSATTASQQAASASGHRLAASNSAQAAALSAAQAAAISTHDDNLVTVFTDAPVLYAGATNGHISPLDVTITTTGGKVRVEFNMNYEVSPDVIFRVHRNGVVLPLPAPSGRITGHFAAGYDNELSSTPIFNSFVIYDDAPAGTHVYGLFYASNAAHGFAFNRTLHDAPLAAYERTVSSSAAWEIK